MIELVWLLIEWIVDLVMKTITINDLKSNMIEVRLKELVEDEGYTLENYLQAADEVVLKFINKELDQFKTEIQNLNTIEDLAPMFDDERLSSWDCHSIIEWTLKHCVEEQIT